MTREQKKQRQTKKKDIKIFATKNKSICLIFKINLK